jgi:two-component system response regulator HydG
VDDEFDGCEVLRLLLENEGYEVIAETSPRRALAKVAREKFHLVLSDITMAEMNGLDLCVKMLELRPLLAVILVTGRASMDAAIQALRLGARDFLTKPVDAEALIASIQRALKPRVLPVEAGRPIAQSGQQSECTLTGVVGQSEGIRQVYRLVADLSASAASVLLQGETGTGKEIIARAIHASSHFSGGPFVALNCAAMPAGLLESELFGHAKGAFTDAKGSSKGLLVEANGGTLLLDEIGELPLAMQPKLLRALQERTVRPVGQHEEVPFNCRVITATNRDLSVEVSAKRFREDLFYRLDVVRITVPPLRERGDDILLLARHFLERFAASARRSIGLPVAFQARLLSYSWPGNVRELENCIERAVALCAGGELSLEDLPDKIRFENLRPAAATPKSEPKPRVASLFEVERSHVLHALESLAGNKTQTADVLGLDRRTLDRRLKRYESSSKTVSKSR